MRLELRKQFTAAFVFNQESSPSSHSLILERVKEFTWEADHVVLPDWPVSTSFWAEYTKFLEHFLFPFHLCLVLSSLLPISKLFVMPPRTKAYVIVSLLTHQRRKRLFIWKNLFRILKRWNDMADGLRDRKGPHNSIPREKRATISEMFIGLLLNLPIKKFNFHDLVKNSTSEFLGIFLRSECLDICRTLVWWNDVGHCVNKQWLELVQMYMKIIFPSPAVSASEPV